MEKCPFRDCKLHEICKLAQPVVRWSNTRDDNFVPSKPDLISPDLLGSCLQKVEILRLIEEKNLPNQVRVHRYFPTDRGDDTVV